MAMFSNSFQPPKTGPSFGWLLPPKADPHLRSVEIGKPLLNFKLSLRLPQKTKPDFFATNAISFRRT